MRKINIKKITVISIVLVISSSFLLIQDRKVESVEPFFTLQAFSHVDDIETGLIYFSLIKQQLARIGIKLDIIVGDSWYQWPFHEPTYLFVDMCYLTMESDQILPYMMPFYTENGSSNFSGYNTDMDYDEKLETGLNEWYLIEGEKINPENMFAEYEHCWEWQNHLMDIILPGLPLFIYKDYLVHYSNLEGLDYNKGLIQSWGNLTWNGIHEGQKNQNEIVISGDNFTGIFPFDQETDTDKLIRKAIMEPLIWMDNDYTYWPHIAENWFSITDTQLRLNIRQNIPWQTDPEGLFPNEYLDAYDVFFTFYCLKELYSDDYYWLKDIQIIDQYTIDFITDVYPETPENESYPYLLHELSNLYILPEHYLNQTQLPDSITPDFTHQSWENFKTNGFGTGLFDVNNFIINKEIILERFDDCWWLNSSLTSDPSLDWINRFGSFTNNIQYLQIKLIQNYLQTQVEFKQGKIDLLEFESVPCQLYYGSEYSILSKNSNKFDMITFNLRQSREWIGNNDPSVYYPEYTKGQFIRKAVSYAINREEINQIIYGGRLEINHWPFPPNLGKWCDPNIGKYCYNLNWSKACMETFDFLGHNGDIIFPEGFPDWKKACGQLNDSSVSYNFYYCFAIFGVIGIIIMRRKKIEEK